MKCEHEGCREEVYTVDVYSECGWYKVEMPMKCKLHLAAWLRAKADEVEGVKECPECNGSGTLCGTCHSTGKVPRRATKEKS